MGHAILSCVNVSHRLAIFVERIQQFSFFFRKFDFVSMRMVVVVMGMIFSEWGPWEGSFEQSACKSSQHFFMSFIGGEKLAKNIWEILEFLRNIVFLISWIVGLETSIMLY